MRAKSQTGSIFLVSFLNIFKRKVNYLNQLFMCFGEKMTFGFQERIVTSPKRIERSFSKTRDYILVVSKWTESKFYSFSQHCVQPIGKMDVTRYVLHNVMSLAFF